MLYSDLIEFDRKYPHYPLSAADFIVRMTEIALPPNQLPVFSVKDRLVQLSDEETFLFYTDFDTLIKRVGLLTDEVKNHVMNFFQIIFVDDVTQQDIDHLCYEAFHSMDLITPPKKTKAKRAKRYNSPIIRSSCSNCDDQALRLQLIKKITNAKIMDLMKIDSFMRALKVENALIATLPPPSEINANLQEQLIGLMERRTYEQNKFLDTDLPQIIDSIKIDWYQNLKPQAPPQAQFNIPETDYESL